MTKDILWQQFIPYLLDQGLTMVPAATFLKAEKVSGYVLLLTKDQLNTLTSPDFLVRKYTLAELALIKLRLEKYILEIYQYDGRQSGKNLLADCEIDDTGYFHLEDEYYFLPIMYYDNDKQT